jgi:hypothetical protein
MSSLQQKYTQLLSSEFKLYPYLNYSNAVLVDNTLISKKRAGFFLLNNLKKVNYCFKHPLYSKFAYDNLKSLKYGFSNINWQYSNAVKDNHNYQILDSKQLVLVKNQTIFLNLIFSSFSTGSLVKYLIFVHFFNNKKFILTLEQ